MQKIIIHNEKQLFEIPNYEGLYSIDCCGNVFSQISNFYLKPQKSANGYLVVNLVKNKKQKTFYIHRFVAELFCKKDNDKIMVNHKNLNKQDNHYLNLEWVTAKENVQHACNNGIRCGEKNGRSKLTTEQVIEIRDKYKFREYTQLQLGKEYNVRQNYISRILKKSVWKHI